MRILIRERRAAADQTAGIERLLDVEVVRIGRGTDQDIQIPDLRVGLAHAEIRREGATYVLRTRGRHQLYCNDHLVSQTVIDVGDRIDCGRYRLSIGAAADGSDAELCVEIVERENLQSQRTTRLMAPRLLLKQSLPMRGLAWFAFLGVLTAFLIAPLLFRYASHAPAPRAALPALTDVAWLPGPASGAHTFFINDCAQCHVTPFVQVRNQACGQCHGALPHHVTTKTALQLPEISGLRCVSCHAEHSGSGLIIDDPALCTACHARTQRHFGGLHLADTTDFATRHPNFTPRLARFDAQQQRFDWQPQSMDKQPLHEDTGLIFPHDKHLARAGIDAPEGKRVLHCDSCHVASADGRSFEKITMAQQCAECHRLDFESADPERVVPHGKPAEIAAELHDYYARKALIGGLHDADAPAVVRARRKPGRELDRQQARAALAWADQRARQTLDELFNKRTCKTCHDVARDTGAAAGWRVAPVALQEHALQNAQFSHAAHRSAPCASCHRAEQSKSSRDVLLPDIARCRDCHGGVRTANKLPSSCTLCHAFHREGAPAMLPAADRPSVTDPLLLPGAEHKP